LAFLLFLSPTFPFLTPAPQPECSITATPDKIRQQPMAGSGGQVVSHTVSSMRDIAAMAAQALGASASRMQEHGGGLPAIKEICGFRQRPACIRLK
jgi:hypothetical protein